MLSCRCRADGKAFECKNGKRFAWATLELSDPTDQGFCDQVEPRTIASTGYGRGCVAPYEPIGMPLCDVLR